MPCEDTWLTVSLKPGFNDRVPPRTRSEHAMESPASFSISEFVSPNYPTADPKVAAQAKAGEDGTHLIGLRTP